MAKRKAHYCERIADRICEYIAEGDSLVTALRKTGPLAPGLATFWKWQADMPEFRTKYELARQMQAEMHADRMTDLAARVLETPSMAPAIRVAADLLKWNAEMRDPAKYSPKAAQEHKAPPKTLKQMRDEVERLQKELGVDVQPGMVTAPKVLRQRQGEEATTPTPALKVVGGNAE